jgi:hypothetical protein
LSPKALSRRIKTKGSDMDIAPYIIGTSTFGPINSRSLSQEEKKPDNPIRQNISKKDFK